jgi:hypothetical protein
MDALASNRQVTKRGFDIRVVCSEAELKKAWSIRYRAYLAVGYIEPSVDERYTDATDFAPGTIQLAAYDGNRCVASMRICHSTNKNDRHLLPCAPYYPDVMTDPDLTSMVEVSRVAIDPDITNTSYRATLYGSLVRTALMSAQVLDAKTILIACKAAWVRFYQVMLGAAAAGQPAFYPPGDIPITLLAIERSAAQRKQRSRNAFFAFGSDEIERLQKSLEKKMPATGGSRASLHVLRTSVERTVSS